MYPLYGKLMDLEIIQIIFSFEIFGTAHTGCAEVNADNGERRSGEFKRVREAALLADKLKLKVHAGHGLDYANIAAVAKIREIEEVNIGHSIISRAVLVGLERAVREMKELLPR